MDLWDGLPDGVQGAWLFLWSFKYDNFLDFLQVSLQMFACQGPSFFQNAGYYASAHKEQSSITI